MGSTPVFFVRTLVVAAVSLLAIVPVSGQVTTLTLDRLHWHDRVGNLHRVQSLNIESYEQNLTDCLCRIGSQ
jgi:hypothetical protein